MNIFTEEIDKKNNLFNRSSQNQPKRKWEIRQKKGKRRQNKHDTSFRRREKKPSIWVYCLSYASEEKAKGSFSRMTKFYLSVLCSHQRNTTDGRNLRTLAEFDSLPNSIWCSQSRDSQKYCDNNHCSTAWCWMKYLASRLSCDVMVFSLVRSLFPLPLDFSLSFWLHRVVSFSFSVNIVSRSSQPPPCFFLSTTLKKLREISSLWSIVGQFSFAL